jgi:hypothetical protein
VSRIVVLGTLAANPYAGMAWMHMQIVAGLRRLGHDVAYVEASSAWPYDPIRETLVDDDEYAVGYLARVAEAFGVGDCWAYRRSFDDGCWLGPLRNRAIELLHGSDVVLNVAGATDPSREAIETEGRLVYLGTDPVFVELEYAAGDPKTRQLVDLHDDAVTYAENIGTPACPVPPLPTQRTTTRQPVLIDLWRAGAPQRDAYTTVGNWRQEGREVGFEGELYYWSKDREFRRVLDLPRRFSRPIELATNLAEPESIHHGEGVAVRTLGLDARALLEGHGWLLAEARGLTMEPGPYRDFIRNSRGEFTVARDLHVRLCSGWFSERSACYLAAGRPVVTQDTGFGTVLPLGEGLFAWRTPDEALGALEAVEADYARHSRAARELAEEYFRAETVLARMLADLGV